jgi:hypothetical protein
VVSNGILHDTILDRLGGVQEQGGPS